METGEREREGGREADAADTKHGERRREMH